MRIIYLASTKFKSADTTRIHFKHYGYLKYSTILLSKNIYKFTFIIKEADELYIKYDIMKWIVTLKTNSKKFPEIFSFFTIKAQEMLKNIINIYPQITIVKLITDKELEIGFSDIRVTDTTIEVDGYILLLNEHLWNQINIFEIIAIKGFLESLVFAFLDFITNAEIYNKLFFPKNFTQEKKLQKILNKFFPYVATTALIYFDNTTR